MLLSAIALAAPARAARLFLSTEHPFAPNSPGAIVKLEVPGARSVDVRLYRLNEPERFFAEQPDLQHVDPLDLASGHHAEPMRRTPGPLALVGQALARAGSDARRSLDRGLSPAARALVAASVQGPDTGPGRALPFLRGLELVERWALPCGAGDAEFSYCDLDIGPRPAGAYLVEAVAGRDIAHAVALFSRLALVARRTEGYVAVLAVDARSGQPVAGAHVVVKVAGQAPQRGVTTRQGLYVAKVPPKPVRVFGELGANAAALELPSVSAAELNRGTFLLTDRGEYRPGERVTFHGFARTSEERLAVPRTDHVQVEAFDARGSLFFSREHALSAQGGFGGDLTLPPGLPQGLCRIVATLEGHAAGAELALRDAPAPAFALDVTLEAPSAGTPARATVRTTAEGRPLTDVQISWRAVHTAFSEEGPGSPEEVDRGDLPVDTDGRASFSFDTLPVADGRYEVSVVARDRAGRIATAQAFAKVVRSPVHVTLETERRLVMPGAPVAVTLLALGEDERPIATDLTVRVRATRGSGGEATRDRLLSRDAKTGSDGKAVIVFTPTSTGYYEVEVSREGKRLAETFLYVTSDGGDIPFSPDTLALVPDKPAYAVGEIARVLVLAPFDTATALMTVEGTDLVRHDALAIRASSAVYSIRVTPGMASDFTVSAQAAFNERAWRTQRVLKVVPRGEALTVRGTLQPSSPGTLRLDISVVDKAGKPAAGAEVFAVVRDALSVDAAAPPIFAFFHPPRLSDGVTASSTDYRTSSSGRPIPRAALDGIEEGYLPFKGLSQGRPRLTDGGTLLAANTTTDARGHAVFELGAPLSVGRLAASARVAAGPAVGEWRTTWDRALPPLDVVAPRFLRPGDQAALVARTEVGRPVTLEVTSAETSCAPSEQVERGTERVSLSLASDGTRRSLCVDVQGASLFVQPIAAAPGDALEIQGTSGVAVAGRVPLPTLEGEGPATLFATRGVKAVAATARRAMGEAAEPMTVRALARLLARLAQWRTSSESKAFHLRTAVLVDVAALVGLAHPEGSFGAYDGAPADLALTAHALIALSLARDEGFEVEEAVMSRAAERLLALKRRGALATLALVLAHEAPADAFTPLLAAERTRELSPSDRAMLAWALDAAGERTRAREVAQRLERSAQVSGSIACFAEPCVAGEASREAIRATAFGILALRHIAPRSTVIAPAVRTLMHHRGTGDFGGDVAGGLAALATATAGDTEPPRPASIALEVGGRVTGGTYPLDSDVEVSLPMPAGAATLTLSGQGPVFWRVSRLAQSPKQTGGLKIARSFAVIDPAGRRVEGPLRVGDRVEITLTLTAEAKTGPVRIEDPYPAGLAPIEQEGENEPFRVLEERAQRLFLPDRVVFLLPAIKSGETALRWEAAARVAGTFAAAPATVITAEGRGQTESVVLEVREVEP